MTVLPRPSLIAYNGYDTGLGNRVRVVLSAQSLAEHEGRRFYYVWPTGPRFGPRFADLWVHPTRGRVVPRALSRGLARLYPYVDESLTWLDDAKRAERVWQVRTGNALALPAGAAPWEDAFRALEPVPAIRERVGRFFDANLRGEPYVGVMIRAHTVSHRRTRETSPVEWFVERMQEIRRHDPSTRFFVSCDVPEVAARVTAAVPGSCTQLDKGAYNSTEGVRASIADLYLLASSGHLIGPHFSSFVHLAQHLVRERLDFETPLTQAAGPVDHRRHGVVRDPLRPAHRDVDTAPGAPSGTGAAQERRPG
ncbi:hypothetical protein [Kineococcus glutinatus]|uniref:Uncharacterized protein n=1 Tax=Kineococcus glutinatus TaxID=1070872 RepID=A0ABP9HNZ7_9ACTN